MNLLIWAVVAYGMTTILVYGSIFNGLRNRIHKNAQPGHGLKVLTPFFSFVSSLIKCMLCTSTWVGFFFSICLGGLTSELFNIGWLPSIFFDGVFTAGIVWAINGIVEFFEENRFGQK